MAKNSASTLIEWGAIIVGALFIFPRILSAMSTNNARVAGSTIPSAAAQQQAARAINTAGLAGNTALGQMLAKLFGQPQQQQPTQAPGKPAAPGGQSPFTFGRQAPPAIGPQVNDLRNNQNLPFVQDYLNSQRQQITDADPFGNPYQPAINLSTDSTLSWLLNQPGDIPDFSPDLSSYYSAPDSTNFWDIFNFNVAPPAEDASGYYSASDSTNFWDVVNFDVAPPMQDAPSDINQNDYSQVYDNWFNQVSDPGPDQSPGYEIDPWGY